MPASSSTPLYPSRQLERSSGNILTGDQNTSPETGVNASAKILSVTSPDTNAASSEEVSGRQIPKIPARPTYLNQGIDSGVGYSSSYRTPYGGYGTGLGAGYNNTYGGIGSYGTYGGLGNRYNRYGSSFGSYGSGYGSYGNYGGYSPYSPYNRGFNPNYPPSTPPNPLITTTQSTFDLLDSIVQSFSGFAAMLDSTFQATYGGFMAMMGAAEQFGMFRQYMGRIIGAMAIGGSLKGWLGRYLRRRKGGKLLEGSSGNALVKEFEGLRRAGNAPGGKGISKTPVLVFLVLVIGLPLLFTKLLRMRITSTTNSPAALDPSKLLFARAEYPFSPSNQYEIPLTPGTIIAVLDKVDPVTGREGEWWKGKLQGGSVGWFPREFVKVVGDLKTLERMKEAQKRHEMGTNERRDGTTEIFTNEYLNEGPKPVGPDEFMA